MRIVISCGGTGGHVRPGMATARRLRERGHEAALWLAGKEIERELVAGWPGPTRVIPAGGLTGGASPRSAGALVRQFRGLLEARAYMRRERPDAVLAMGGYGCLGPVLSARSLGVPVVLHEANAVPGSAVSLLARFAAVVAVGMESARACTPGRRVVTTGIPVDVDQDARFEAGTLISDLPTVLVMGGSQGSRTLNRTAPLAFGALRQRGSPLQVVHLSGREDERDVRDAYAARGVPHVVLGFLTEMGKAYNAADFAVARAGALTCAEFCAYGLPAVLVPLPWAKRDHQTANARVLQRAGGCEIMEERALSPARLADRVESCLGDAERLDRMRRAAQSMAVPDAAERLANLVEQQGKP
jgi:UDP-N-acetylglucosamine--N-acetylmuramyl-(pentapeptide) pyrophosphoryl-undecaprenol N-acetylglucosamine transferase